MIWTDFVTAYRELQDRKLKLMEGKSHDYAADSDRFSTFRDVAAATGLSPEQIILVQIGIKMTRLANLLGAGKTPVNESVTDSAIDQANYADIMAVFAETIPLSPEIIDVCAKLSIDADVLILLLMKWQAREEDKKNREIDNNLYAAEEACRDQLEREEKKE